MIKILIADKLSNVGVEWLRQQDDVEVGVQPGLPPDELAKVAREYDGMIIRSGVKVNDVVLADPGRLRGIARAGVGVDNVDVKLATARGIIVMNTPGGNTLSTTELTLALMLALSRKVAPANASLKAGQWDRKAFQGTQLAGKTLGIVGMGRIGRAVALRAAALEMRVLGFDPFFAGPAEQGTFEMVKDLIELCKRSDYITVHVPKGPDTLGMIGAAQFAAMKPTVRLINAARGGIIDTAELLKALEAGRVAGAALDVYASEPPANEAELALIGHPNVLAVPHLGASTEEAQDQVALDAAQQLVEALRGGEVRHAVNAPGFGAIPPHIQPYAELARRMGTVLAQITPGALREVEVIYRGRIAEENTQPLTTYLLVGLIQPYMDQPVNVVNAPVFAQERGVDVRHTTSAKVKEFTNVVEARIVTDQGSRTAKGTIFGNRFPRVIAIDGYSMELKPEGCVLILFNDDRPGVVGKYGTILGNRNVNISDMTFSRKREPKKAVVGINLDSAPPRDVIEEIRSQEFVDAVYYLELPGL